MSSHWMFNIISCSVFILHILSFKSAADLNIISPSKWIRKGNIRHNMALFGRPDYGGKIIGSIVMSPKSNIDGCRPYNDSEVEEWKLDQGSSYILMIERGNCHFVNKVRNAQAASASAAIIYDTHDSTEVLPIMADDRTGMDVHIPSLIIHHQDAVELNKSIDNETVIGVITWRVPHPDNRVEWSLWDSSKSTQSPGFYKNYKILFDAFSNHTQFSPHYEVYDGDKWRCEEKDNSCDKLCLYEDKFCTFDPEDNPTFGLDGTDVLLEDIRQLCIWKIENTTTNGNLSAWWDYKIRFNQKCNFENATKSEFNERCSVEIQKELKMDVKKIKECSDNDGENLLALEAKRKKDYGIVSVPRVVVNELQHYGDIVCPLPIRIGSCSPLRMICHGFKSGTEPSPCSNSFWEKECFYPKKIDDCGNCLVPEDKLWNKNCQGCDGKPNSGKMLDECGVCGGNGGFDKCGICLPKNSSEWNKRCVDCKGVINGHSRLDPCGKCNGHGSFDACGLCFEQDDPRRQNFGCKVEDDPDAIRIKVILKGILPKSFTGDVYKSFNTVLHEVTNVQENEIVIKSIVQGDAQSTIVYFFIVTGNDESRDQALKELKKEDASINIGIRMKQIDKLSTLTGIKLLFIETGDRIKESTTQVNSEIENASNSNGGFVLGLTMFLIGFVVVGFLVMRRREQKIRGDIYQMFAKYTPLVVADDDDQDDPLFSR